MRRKEVKTMNLKAEMARKNISIEELAAVLGIHRNSASAKLNGKSQFTIEEAFTIKEHFFNDCTLEYLFRRDE